MCDDWTSFEFCDLDMIPHLPCVYFLMNDDELVYVGQTSNLHFRVLAHKRKYNCGTFEGGIPIFQDTFNSLYYYECGYKPERKEYESMFREDYYPKLNGNDWDVGERIMLELKKRELVEYHKKRELEEKKLRGWVQNP